MVDVLGDHRSNDRGDSQSGTSSTCTAVLTGLHLMRTGRLEPHLPTLNQEFHLDQVNFLLQQRQDPAAPQTVTPRENHACLQEARQLTKELETAADRSHLPRDLNTKPALNDLLLRIRKQAS